MRWDATRNRPRSLAYGSLRKKPPHLIPNPHTPRGVKSQPALRGQFSTGLDTQQLELEATLQQQQANTHDYLEGAAAFLERSDPKFTGERAESPSTPERLDRTSPNHAIDGEAYVGTDDGEW